MVDEQVDVYTAVQLMLTKIMHETWVKESIDGIVNGSKNEPQKINRITSGKGLVNIINSVHAYSFDHDEPKNEAEASEIAIFFESMEDHGDLMGMGSIDKSAQVQLGMQFKKQLDDLEALGFWVFGERRKQLMQDGDGMPLGKWDVAVLHVIRNNSTKIVKL